MKPNNIDAIQILNNINILSLNELKHEKYIFIDVIDLCSNLINHIIDEDGDKINIAYKKIISFPRIYMESYSDWDNPIFIHIERLKQINL